MCSNRVVLRPTRGADLARIRQLQDLAYAPELPPDRYSGLRSRLKAGGAVCAVVEVGGSVVGHVQALPWPSGHVLRLDERLAPGAAQGDSLFVYEVVVHPAMQGRGLARRLMAEVERQARRRGVSRLGLVAYGQAAGYWQVLGFRPHPLRDDAARDALASYGGQGQYMLKALD
ncbi:GNAT family N-acetyltransferase [Caldimonas thermodepolymerans]|jgi:GNAT superfamily N-acetyltransferase|nr:GNAT family N-acetyltransferase [Caldimonas thermodepolymerans]QPC30898.1 GNAT family N-acetyltransferase [Caldimonas thermodepolymerans]RDH97096.1 putative N-acetyltransferase YhbS [Caldimonas thermodepolymerans]TCP09002.1 putative N-acetyltransferase YhbS [Caldimonas thermodepolymerans]UZG43637.1 GNAT family N-acetyltransferase [Caldimonas thermodepolymerans]UZG47302.1 GNAT family N-acetyltransferase [Caldimonas thermodepolymerans]